jgi:hypothetical protein
VIESGTPITYNMSSIRGTSRNASPGGLPTG